MSGMEKQYEHLSRSVVTEAETSIKKETKKRKYNGRVMSVRTKSLHDLRTHDYNSGRNITK